MKICGTDRKVRLTRRTLLEMGLLWSLSGCRHEQLRISGDVQGERARSSGGTGEVLERDRLEAAADPSDAQGTSEQVAVQPDPSDVDQGSRRSRRRRRRRRD